MLLSRLQSGDRPAVVLVPGLQGDPRVFEPLITQLEGHEVWGVRLSRGGLRQDAVSLSERLMELGLSGSRIVGGSYGGQVALRVEIPLHSVVLTGSFGDWGQVPWKQRLFLRSALRLPSSLLGHRYNATLRARLAADGVPESVANQVEGPGGAALRARLRSLIGQSAPRLRCPALWVAGERDVQAPWDADTLRQVWPSVTVRRLPGQHRPYASHPVEFAVALHDWWRSVDARH